MKIDKLFLDELTRKVLKFPSEKFSKGALGKICVIGGSDYYTGAPYFSAISSLRLGCDLSYVICPPSAAIPIKSYSPDIIVLPIIDDTLFESFNSISHSFDSFVFGPGLGRYENNYFKLEKILEIIVKSKKPCVIDADGLGFATKYSSIINGSNSVFLTPNVNESKRMASKFNLNESFKTSDLSNAFGGCWLLAKGSDDMISGFGKEYINDIPGSPRRCGGQGDILSGVLATTLKWVSQSEKEICEGLPNFAAAGLVSSYIVRNLSRKIFENKGMGMITSDLIEYLPIYLHENFKQDYFCSE